MMNLNKFLAGCILLVIFGIGSADAIPNIRVHFSPLAVTQGNPLSDNAACSVIADSSYTEITGTAGSYQIPFNHSKFNSLLDGDYQVCVRITDTRYTGAGRFKYTRASRIEGSETVKQFQKIIDVNTAPVASQASLIAYDVAVDSVTTTAKIGHNLICQGNALDVNGDDLLYTFYWTGLTDQVLIEETINSNISIQPVSKTHIGRLITCSYDVSEIANPQNEDSNVSDKSLTPKRRHLIDFPLGFYNDAQSSYDTILAAATANVPLSVSVAVKNALDDYISTSAETLDPGIMKDASDTLEVGVAMLPYLASINSTPADFVFGLGSMTKAVYYDPELPSNQITSLHISNIETLALLMMNEASCAYNKTSAQLILASAKVSTDVAKVIELSQLAEDRASQAESFSVLSGRVCNKRPSFSTPVCEEGSSYDHTFNICVSQSECPEGTSLEASTGDCVVVTDDLCTSIGGTNINGVCQSAPSCDSPSTFNASLGQCTSVPGPPQNPLDPKPSCPPGTSYNLSSNSCVRNANPTCPTGTSYNSVSKICSAPINPPVTPLTCIQKGGQVQSDGFCLLKSCTSFQVYNKSTKSCESQPYSPPVDTNANTNSGNQNNASTPSCPSGSTYNTQRRLCVSPASSSPSCSSGYTYNSISRSCISNSSSTSGCAQSGGWIGSDGKCHKNAPPCGPNQSYNASTNTCNSKPVDSVTSSPVAPPANPSSTPDNSCRKECKKMKWGETKCSWHGDCGGGGNDCPWYGCSAPAPPSGTCVPNAGNNWCNIGDTVCSPTAGNNYCGAGSVTCVPTAGNNFCGVAQNTKVNCGGGSSGGYPSCSCPSGQVYNLTINSCQTPPTVTVYCPSGASGNYPSCSCPSGKTYNPAGNSCFTPATVSCPSGSTGGYPACSCPSGKSYDPVNNNCFVPSTVKCPSGSSGTYPACSCTGGKSYNPASNACFTPPAVQCPSGSTGGHPNCSCTGGKSFDPVSNSCFTPIKIQCPSGSSGGYPACSCTGGKSFDPASNICFTPPAIQCPAGSTGGHPSCSCSGGKSYDPVGNSCFTPLTISCPVGSTGGYPACDCSGGKYFDPVQNACYTPPGITCPVGSSGGHPNCSCSNGQSYDPVGNLCFEPLSISCPAGSSGGYPNCSCSNGQSYDPVGNQCFTPLSISCPVNATGGYPSCVCPVGEVYDPTSNICFTNPLPNCPAGSSGSYPACSCPNGDSFDPIGNQCFTPLAISCPVGASGGYPACNCPNGDYFNPAGNVCFQPPAISCPSGATGGHPACSCPSGKSYDPIGNICFTPVSISCPAGASGGYPACSCPDGKSFDPIGNQCFVPGSISCPGDATGGYPACHCGEGIFYDGLACRNNVKIPDPPECNVFNNYCKPMKCRATLFSSCPGDDNNEVPTAESNVPSKQCTERGAIYSETRDICESPPCSYLGVPPSYFDEGNQVCVTPVPSSFIDPLNPSVDCPWDNQVFDEALSACVSRATCGNDEIYNEIDNTCESAKAASNGFITCRVGGSVLDHGSGECLCPSGTSVNTLLNSCVDTVDSCPASGQVSVEGFCLCPENFSLDLDANSCVADADLTPPVDGFFFLSTNVDALGFTLHWSISVDNITSQDDLEYMLCSGISLEAIDTVSECESSVIEMNYSKDTLTKVITWKSPLTTYYYNVVVKDVAQNKTIYTPISQATTADITAPIVGVFTETSSITDSGFTLNWSEAGDNVTPSTMLKYLLCSGPTAVSIDTISECELSANTVMEYTENIYSNEITGLSPSTTYFFNIVVKDSFENKAIYSVKSQLSGVDITPPTAGVFEASINVEATSFTLNWSEASDNGTSTPFLEYLLCSGVSPSSIDTVEECENSSPQIMGYTYNALTFPVTGLIPLTTYYYNVVVRDLSNNKSLFGYFSQATLADNTAPVVGEFLSSTSVSSSGFTLNWSASTDNASPQASLQYLLCSGSSVSSIDTVSECESSSIEMDYTSNVLTANISGKSGSSTYFFNVVVKDAAGNKAVYNALSQQTVFSATTTSSVESSGTVRRTFYDTVNGKHWAFYIDGTSIKSQYSTDSIDYFSGDSLSANASGFTLHYKAVSGVGYVFLVSEENTHDIVIRRGVLSASSVSFESPITVFNGTSVNDLYRTPAVTSDETNLWVAASRYTGSAGTWSTVVRESSNSLINSLGVWENVSTLGTPTSSPRDITLLPRGGENLFLLYKDGVSVVGYEYDSSAWTLKSSGGDLSWFTIAGEGGVNSRVYGLAVIGADLYVGGEFTSAGGVPVNSIAKWNGSVWSPLGTGLNGVVNELTAIGSDLYAGGSFTTAGGASANQVAKWNGATWSPLGTGLNNSVYILGEFGGDLIVGGNFTTAGGISANRIAKWDGSSWSALGDGVSGSVFALKASGTDLFAGGLFTTAGVVSANNIAKWDGSTWSTLGQGTNGPVYAITSSGSNLFVGGEFNTAGASSASNIAKWDGSSWTQLGTGTSHTVLTLAVIGSNVYAGGDFTFAGGISVNYAARWDGASWSPLGAGMSNSVFTLSVIGSDLFAGGHFTTAGGSSAVRIAGWDGNDWYALGKGLNSSVSALSVIGSDLYAAGNFTAIGGVYANYVAKWNGTIWSPLGSGTNGAVNSLSVVGTTLYAGGDFTLAGGASANYVAQWDGSAWSTLGSGVNNTVYALHTSEQNLYVGGSFTTAGGASHNRVALWDGTSWVGLGSGTDNTVRAVATIGGDVFVGGNFITAGGVTVNRVARWNGSSWSALGTTPGVAGGTLQVNALAASGNDLFVGGGFLTAGGVSALRIAKWNTVTSTWTALGTGAASLVNALLVVGGDLYAGGNFTSIGGGSASFRVARWNGSTWSSVGSGTNSMVSALTTLNSELISGSSSISVLKNAAITDVASYSAVVNDVSEPVILYSTSAGVVRTKKLALASGNWTAASTVQSGTSGRTVLSSVSGLNRLVGFWLRSGNIEFKKFNGASWDSTPTVLFDSSLAARFSSCDETSGGGMIKCIATSNSLPPFDVTTRRVVNP